MRWNLYRRQLLFLHARGHIRKNNNKMNGNGTPSQSTIDSKIRVLNASQLFSTAKKNIHSQPQFSNSKILAEDSDDNASFIGEEDKENVCRKISFAQSGDSSNDSSYLLSILDTQSPFHKKEDECSSQDISEIHIFRSNDSSLEHNDSKQSRLTSQDHPKEFGKNSNCDSDTTRPSRKTKTDVSNISQPGDEKRFHEVYDSSFIDDEDDGNITSSDGCSESSVQSASELFSDGDIPTPPSVQLHKSQRRTCAKSKFELYKKCVTDKKNKDDIKSHKTPNPKYLSASKTPRRRIVVPSDSSEDEEEYDNSKIPQILSPASEERTQSEQENGSSGSDTFEIDKIKDNVRKNILKANSSGMFSEKHNSINNELVENGENYDNSFINDSESEDIDSTTSQSTSEADDSLADDLELEPAESSLICDLNGIDDQDEDSSEPNNSLNPNEKKLTGGRNPIYQPPKVKTNERDFFISKGKPNTLSKPITKTFLSSLSTENWDEKECHPEAVKYVKHFSRHKQELAKR